MPSHAHAPWRSPSPAQRVLRMKAGKASRESCDGVAPYAACALGQAEEGGQRRAA